MEVDKTKIGSDDQKVASDEPKIDEVKSQDLQEKKQEAKDDLPPPSFEDLISW